MANTSPSSVLRPPRVQDAAATAVAQFLQRAEDDDVVCAFGPDYFRGAATGSFFGVLIASTLCGYTFRVLKADQREVDFLSGLRRGQRNRHFSSWTLLRGLHTQPMLTVGCMALGATTAMKCAKCYLANRRCREFYCDDVELAILHERSADDPKAAALLEAIEREGGADSSKTISPLAIKSAAVAELHKTPASSADSTTSAASSALPLTSSPSATSALSSSLKPGASVKDLLRAYDPKNMGAGGSKLIHRYPTFWDGVAVAFVGSVMDCYLPQKPVQKYHNMHGGLW